MTAQGQNNTIPSLYEWAGGMDTFERLIVLFYKKVVVDELIGKHEVVIKTLGAMFKDLPDKISGNTHRARQTVREQVDHKAQWERLNETRSSGHASKKSKVTQWKSLIIVAI